MAWSLIKTMVLGPRKSEYLELGPRNVRFKKCPRCILNTVTLICAALREKKRKKAVTILHFVEEDSNMPG